MKKFILFALMLICFSATAQSTGPITFDNKYATVVEKDKVYEPKNEFYYPTTVTVDISAKRITFEYLHDSENVSMVCKIFDYEISENMEYTDIQTTPPNGENVLFRFYNDQIYVVFKDMYIILNN